MRQVLSILAVLAMLGCATGFAQSTGASLGYPQLDDDPSFVGFADDRIVIRLRDEVAVDHDRDAKSTLALQHLDGMARLSADHRVVSLQPQFRGADKKAEKNGTATLQALAHYYKVELEAGSLAEALSAFRKNPAVQSADPIPLHRFHAHPNEAFFTNYQWNLWGPHGLDMREAWDVETGDTLALIGIMDTGIEYDHEDLGGYFPPSPTGFWTHGNIWINSNETPNNGTDEDGNGYIDDLIGWDFVADVGTTYVCVDADCGGADNDPRDSDGHGTHVAGIAGAITNNGEGIAGIAGGWSDGSFAVGGYGARLVPLRVGWTIFYPGYGELAIVAMDYVAEAMYYLGDLKSQGWNVAAVNLSAGTSSWAGMPEATDYLISQDVVICVSAGNDGDSVSGYLQQRSDCLTVAATDQAGDPAWFTNYGPSVDIAAPGVDIISTHVTPPGQANDDYEYKNGTSMAAPHVAGVIGLLEALNGELSAADKMAIVTNPTNASPYGGQLDLGAGIINARLCVEAARPTFVVQESPVAGLIAASNTGALSVTFDRPMLEASFNTYTFRVHSASRGKIDGSVVYSPASQTAFFILDDMLPMGDRIQVTLTEDIVSELGTNLLGGYSWEFAVDNCASADFYPADEFPAPSQGPYWPQRLVAADFTGDGAVDVVVATTASYNPLSLMVNDGNGGLNPAQPIALGQNTDPDGPSAGDFDHDGDIDLAVPCAGSETIAIMFNDGTGSFTIEHEYSVPNIGGGSATGDMNGDGTVDIVVVKDAEDQFAVLFNSGYGSFAGDVPWGTLSVPARPKIVDINNDGLLDVVLASIGADAVSVFINEFSRFPDRYDFPAGLQISNLTAADFNGDGFIDIASTSLFDNQCAVYTNSGTGTFSLSQTFGGVSSAAITAADVDGDNDFDLLTGTYNKDSDQLEWAENDGGIFTLNNICCSDRTGFDVAAVDMDGEGSIDVVCLNTFDDKIVVVRNYGPPAAPQLYAPVDGRVMEAPARPRLTCLATPGGIYYQFQIDADPAFGSPQYSSTFNQALSWSPIYALGAGTHYWRVRSANTCGLGEWSEVRTIEVESDPVTPSCPVLFVETDKGMVQENPLLTACERSGYVNTVVDYYPLQSSPATSGGRVTVQLRELEDEITYLEQFELMTVDHPVSTRVACGVDGAVQLYSEMLPPISAMTADGIDVRDLLVETDGKRFEATEGGSLTLTFPRLEAGRAIVVSAQKKPPCPHDDGGGEKQIAELSSGAFTVQQRMSGGQWSMLAEPPTREAAVDQVVMLDWPLGEKERTITVRITWEGAFSTDAISEILDAGVTATVNTWQLSDYSVTRDRPTMEMWDGFEAEKPLTLRKNDHLICSFAVPPVSGKDMARTYIVKAVGKYQPDYGVYKNLMPNQYTLYENYPNPFNPSTTIAYDLPRATEVTLDIINVLGQTIRTLVQKTETAGHHRAVWDGCTDSGQPVASGLYFYRLSAETFSQTKKMMLVK